MQPKEHLMSSFLLRYLSFAVLEAMETLQLCICADCRWQEFLPISPRSTWGHVWTCRLRNVPSAWWNTHAEFYQFFWSPFKFGAVDIPTTLGEAGRLWALVPACRGVGSTVPWGGQEGALGSLARWSSEENNVKIVSNDHIIPRWLTGGFEVISSSWSWTG